MIQKLGLCVALILLSGRSVAAQWGGSLDDKSVPSITVSGGAEIKVAPDEVHLSLGVESRDPKLETAKKLNDEKLAAVMTFLKGMKIEAKDIQTDFIGISPHYNDSDEIAPNWYVVRQGLDIKLRRVSDYDAALTGVLKHGATHIHGIEFRTTELRKHRDAARKLAIKAAKPEFGLSHQPLDARQGLQLLGFFRGQLQ